MKRVFILIATILLSAGKLWAQDISASDQIQKTDSDKSAARGFFLTGNGYVNFEKMSNEEKPIVHGALYPILLWQFSDKLFFESETAVEISKDETKGNIEYATLHYVINKYFIIGAGKFLSPFGTYQERLHPLWVNKFPEAPLGFSHDGAVVGPMAEIGFEIRGGAPLGSSKINYAAYISNGPALISESSDPMMAGMLENGELKDNNSNKAIGGRLGFLPLSNSSFEIGISRQDAKVGDENDSLLSKARVAMHAFDISYVHGISFLKSIVDIKGQFNHVMLDKTNSGTTNMDSMSSEQDLYSISKTFYMQIACRPAMSNNNVLQKMELCTRYSLLKTSEAGMSGDNTTQLAIGLNYWFSWRSVFKIAYQLTREKDGHRESALLIQLAIAHPKINFKKKKETAENK